MKNQSKTKQALIQELDFLMQRIEELEQSEVERKKIEEALRESEERFRSLFDRSLDCLYIHNFKGQFIDANPAALRLFGYNKEEIPSLNFATLISDDQIPKALEVLAEVKQTGFQKELSEFRVRRKDGSHVYLETKSAIVYHVGKPSAILGIARDITKRKQMEDDLRISEERYRTIIQNIEDGYYEVDTTGNMTFCNSSAAKMLGYRQDELIGLNNQQYMNHENAQKVFSTFNKVFRTGQPTKTFDWELIRRDGKKLIVETSVSLIRDTKEKPVGFRGIFRDITERKQVEEALRESEDKFRTIFDRASDGILIVDAQNRKFLQGNATICSMLGYTKEEIKSLTLPDIHSPNDISHVLDEFEKLIKGDKALAEGLPVLKKDGSIFYADISSTSTTIEGRHHLVGIFRDITERKQVEEAFRESEERYRTLVENASDIVFRLDNTGHITFVNPAALHIIGYEEKEIIGRHYPTFIRSDMQEDAMKFFGRQFVKGIHNTYSEYPVIVKDGREIWLGQNTQLIFQDGKVVAFQAVARDITERKRAEETLKESENRYRDLSIIDDLTQLYNSRHFYDQLKMEIDRVDRYGQPLTLLLLDLDDFKRFNDEYGHVEGDQVLMRLGQVIKRCLRRIDSAYRYGGEEFTIILPTTTSEDGAVTAERIRAEFKKENFSPKSVQDVHLTVSIGLAQYKPQEEMKAFVHRVDQLMYQGKKNGKNRVCCES
jgi:diguanylate cyclase (GGDEF)-like protein/PAS domain S-box-containing protein